MADISVAAAFSNIWKRLRNAVEEGKKKAGVTTENKPGVMEAADDDIFGSDDDDDSDDVFGDIGASDTDSQDSSGIEMVSDESDASEQDVFGGEEPAPATSSRRKITGKLTNEEDSTPKGNNIRKQWSANKAEITSQVLDLFKYAKENAQYLKDNNEEFITKDELRAIFIAEYMNYTSGEGQSNLTIRAINRTPDIFNKKIDDIHAKFNAMLHGRSTASAKSGGEEFLSSGSLMSYLQSPARKMEEKQPILKPSTNLVYGGEDGVCNFILAEDLDNCKTVISKILGKKTGMPVDKFDKYVSNLALNVLANGMSGKEGVQQKLGGHVVSAYKKPRYGSIEKDGDNMAILGGKEFLSEFKNQFKSFVAASMDFMDDDFDDIPNPEIKQAVNQKGNNRLGVFKVSYPDKPYFNKINLAVQEGIIIPIAFNAGMVSLNKGGTGTGGSNGPKDGTEAGFSEKILSHADAAGAESGDLNLGEIAASNELLGVLNEPATQALAEKLDIMPEWEQAINNMDNIPTVSKFTATLLGKLATKAGIAFDIKNARNEYALNLHNDKSFINMYKSSDSDLKLDGDWFKPTRHSYGKDKSPESIVRLASTFNDFVLDRINKVQRGSDIADYTDMDEAEFKKPDTQYTLREKLVPVVHIGDMAADLFNNPSTESLDFIKAYLLMYTGGAAGFSDNSKSVFQNPSDFVKKLQNMGLNINMENLRAENVKALIDNLGINDVSTLGEIYEQIVQDSTHTTKDDESEGSKFFDSSDIIPVDKLGTTLIAKALVYDNPEKYPTVGEAKQYLMRLVDFIIGAKDGFIQSYMTLLNGGNQEDGEKGLTKDKLNDIIPAAREIKTNGNGIVSINLSDSSSEKYKFFNKK